MYMLCVLILQGTRKQDKNELLFNSFGINYKTRDPIFRQGTCLFKTQVHIGYCFPDFVLVTIFDGLAFSHWFEFQKLQSFDQMIFIMNYGVILTPSIELMLNQWAQNLVVFPIRYSACVRIIYLIHLLYLFAH